MVGTILPIVYGERKRRQPPVTLLLHMLGYILGAAVVGAVLAALGMALLRQTPSVIRNFPVFVATGLVSLVYSGREFGLVPVPAPQFSRQVPHSWRLLFPPRIRALSYGLGLGVGLATRIPVSTFYVAAFWATFSGNPLRGSLAMTAFGVGRALPILLIDKTCDALSERPRLMRGLSRWEPVVHLVNGLALACAGAWLMVSNFISR